MTCCDELTLMMYADGELEDGPRREVGVHVDQCRRCASLLAALHGESRVVAIAVRDEDTASAAVARPVPGRQTSAALRVAAAAASVALGAALLRFLVESAGLAPLAALPDWLNPLSSQGQSNLLFNTAAYLVLEGDLIMSLVMGSASVLALAVLALSFAPAAGRLARGRSVLASLVLLSVLLPAAAADALEVRRAERTLTIASDQTIDDTVIAAAETVEVDGTITGDLIAVGRRVRVRGMVRGNLITAAQNIEIEGTVDGSVLQFGQTVTNRGQTGGNLYAFGQTITTPGVARVGGNVTVFSETATIEGSVGHDVTSFGRQLDLGGSVGRRVNAYGDRVDIRSSARIDGGLTAHVANRENVRVDPGATVGGETRIDVTEPSPSRFATSSFYVRQVIRLAAAFIAGWIFFRLVPRAAAITLGTGGAALTALGIGAVAACATPVLAIVVGITIVGLPIAVFAVLLWIVLLYLAKIVIALLVGRALVGASARGIATALLAGLVLVIVAVNLPYVGGLVSLLLTVTGLGVLVVEASRWYRGSGGVPVRA
ncbi:MAG TPA: zf-HC2 domain-containing protein [Vicinamibacterales bacterium]|nr:zf-HC2 domain-containing protein [Vicinamibacterales bacterium]